MGPDRNTVRTQPRQAKASVLRPTGYRGIRVGKSGRPFWIEDVTMWDLIDADGTMHGQAAVIRSWSDA
ncbi:MEKHLA domain-containing protein [Streptomyces sp. NPDC050287]|uniref:MEKHLA domain-containing protein n=1 Tax=Streptomyces sp. NPDC050287 TaxID=3365608 RepID=UPI0037AE4F25